MNGGPRVNGVEACRVNFVNELRQLVLLLVEGLVILVVNHHRVALIELRMDSRLVIVSKHNLL